MIKIVLAIIMLSGMLWSLDWAKDFDTAIATAEKEHKNVMLMVEGEHCRWCKKMKSSTLSEESIEKRLVNYVIVKVLRKNANVMSKLPSVGGVPTIFFMKADKTILQETLGYETVSDFNATLNGIEKKIQ